MLINDTATMNESTSERYVLSWMMWRREKWLVAKARRQAALRKNMINLLHFCTLCRSLSLALPLLISILFLQLHLPLLIQLPLLRVQLPYYCVNFFILKLLNQYSFTSRSDSCNGTNRGVSSFLLYVTWLWHRFSFEATFIGGDSVVSERVWPNLAPRKKHKKSNEDDEACRISFGGSAHVEILK